MIPDAIRRAQLNYPVDIQGLCAELGIELHPAWLDSDVSGELVPLEGGRYRINVNADHSPLRQRFTAAHEIGHFVYHRDLIGSGLDDDRAYRSTDTGRYHNTNIGPREETEANRFASNLLMPDHLMERAKAAGLNTPEELAGAFLVSVPAMRVRMGLPPRVTPNGV